MTEVERRPLVRERIEEVAREIGVLFIALAPLDAVLAERKVAAWLLIILAVGFLLLAGAIASERRRP